MKEVGQKNALDIEIVREKLHELGIELLSKEYLNNYTDLSVGISNDMTIQLLGILCRVAEESAPFVPRKQRQLHQITRLLPKDIVEKL